MQAHFGDSCWSEFNLPKFAPLVCQGHFDVAIVGAGITGLTAAYLLTKSGKSVCVLERDEIGAGDTGKTTAHLTYVTDTDISTLVNTFGRERAGLAWEAGAIAIDTIESIIKELGIDCEFTHVPAYRHLPWNLKEDDASDRDLKEEFKLVQELGFNAEYLEEIPIIGTPGIRFMNQAIFHPLKYLQGLANAITRHRSVIHEHSEVTEIEGDPCKVKVNGVEVIAEKVIIATHVPLMGKSGLLRAGTFQSKLAGYSTYAIQGTLHEPQSAASYWDTADPYHYLRIDNGAAPGRVVLGGSDHKTGQETNTERCFEHLEQLLHTLFPTATIERAWTGEVIEPNDGLPFIGEMETGEFIATGFSGNGMTFGTFAAIMAREWVEGKENVWQDLFSVDRGAIRNAPLRYIKENADYPYYLVADRLSAESERRPIDPGTGRIQRRGNDYLAVACDDDGTCFEVSGVCTHLGCLVRWNSAVKSWDCPCHGSRFKIDGSVIEGPAETPLELRNKYQQ